MIEREYGAFPPLWVHPPENEPIFWRLARNRRRLPPLLVSDRVKA